MSNEEGPRSPEEGDGGCRGLVSEGFGVGQAGVAVDRGVQVGVAHALVAGPFTAVALESPASTGGDLSDLLHVQVEHMPGKRVMIFPGSRLFSPVGTGSRRREIPSLSSQRPTVRTQ